MTLLQSMYARHGEVFTVPLLHKRMTFLLGPSVSPHFYNGNDDAMSQTEVYKFNVPTFGKGVVYDVDQKIRSEQFRLVADALKSSKLKGYVPDLVDEAHKYFAGWGETGVVDLFEEFSRLIILTASRTLMGREVRESMFEEVASLYHDLDDGMRPLSVLFPYLPTEYHRKRDAARDKLKEIFAGIIARRRAEGIVENDMLQVLMDGRYKNAYGGRQLNSDEVTGLLIALLFAGQHTSSTVSAWTGYFLAGGDPKNYAKLEEEQRKTVAAFGDDISFESLQSLDFMHLCITEALRINPPLVLLMRSAKKPFTVMDSAGKSFTIPKGDIVATSPTFQHRMETLFPRPLDFEPERFAPPRDEDKAKPFTFIGFGGGRHGCMGQMFAYVQIKTIWSILVRNFTFELVDPFPEPNYQSMVIGPLPCRVRYTRRKL